MWGEVEFTALIDRFSSSPSAPIAVAVSGGGDSLALLNLCHKWAKQNDRRLKAYTVDHQLRADSRSEAEYVSKLCGAWGIPHQILTWDAPKPTQSAARLARYRMLAAAMKMDGVSCLLTGHTFDDVVETALMRRRRGVRDASVAGPTLSAPFPIWPEGRGLSLLRPLLSRRRSDLRALLRAAEIEWVDDPSNHNPNFERVRVRQFLARNPTLRRLVEQAIVRLHKERVISDQGLAKDLSLIAVRQDGTIDSGAAPCSARLLTLLARVASGGVRDARGHAMDELKRTLINPGERKTLGGAWFQRTPTGYLIGRDPGVSLGCSDDGEFDGRYARDLEAQMPTAADASFLVRHALPPGPGWREIISERLAHLRLCLQTTGLQMGVETP